MELEKKAARNQAAPAEGCLVTAVRLPVRIVALVVVVPVRLVWDALVAIGRVLRDWVLRPLGRALLWVGKALFVWPWVALWRYVVVPVGKALGWLGHVLLVVPAGWVYRYVLTPVGRGLAWLGRVLVVVPAGWLYRYVLAPVGYGIGVALYWTARVLLVLPALALWRWVLVPVGRVLAVIGREVWDALKHAWRIAGYVSRAVGRLLGTLFRWILVEPVRWTYRTVLTPVGHVVRDVVWRPAAAAARAVGRAARQVLAPVRDSLRRARADVRRLLLGGPRRPERHRRVVHGEPGGPETRTLGSSTTALTKD
ncbi:hypothetical protein GCM10010145_27160 [Streptomyces ruber]|uniref:Uncharacterized protein n=2 Tax=Streptomyces TaxID=1883 RepID=A0A918BBN3_9ACTN|nr:hypothetical protein [Streptomyces ruber]GGQ55808.1 hypothetical protein GCM10010145_27160 [Streptomyces ruber]